MLLRKVLFGFSTLLFICSPAIASPILTNGSFELGVPPFGFHDLDIPAGSTDITGWTITGGGVDLLEDPWAVSDGVRAIDLDLRSPGGIEQTFATVIGQLYAVSFDLSGNPEGGSALKSMNVSVGGVSHNYTFDSTGQTLMTLTWQPVMFSFVAPFASATMVFTSLSDSSSSFGALIDHVEVAAVPEPSMWLLLLAGSVALARVSHRYRGAGAY